MKLTKKQYQNHLQAEEYLKKETLSFEEKIFVLEHWHEGAENINSQAGAFFTPMGLAEDFAFCSVPQNTQIIDLCAGIGMLSFFAYHYQHCQVVCVELNPDYVRVGKKILPQATWINASVTDETILNLGKFDVAISNPPFGKIKTAQTPPNGNYKGSEFEFIVMDIASQIADKGSFIIPQNSTPFRFSGENSFKEVRNIQKVEKFLTETQLEMKLNACIDTSYYQNDWNGVSPLCEVIEIEF